MRSFCWESVQAFLCASSVNALSHTHTEPLSGGSYKCSPRSIERISALLVARRPEFSLIVGWREDNKREATEKKRSSTPLS